MMSLIKPKQIEKLVSGYITIDTKPVTIGSTTTVITTEVATKLTTAGYMSSPLDNVESTAENLKGLITSSPENYVNISINPNLTKILVANKEVYGRLTKIGVDWVVTFYYFNASGVETACVLPNNYNIRLNLPYRFDLKDLPTDVVIQLLYDRIAAGYGMFDNSHTDIRYNVSVGLGTSNGLITGTGERNTVLGYMSGYSNILGDRNIFIGYKAGYHELGSDKFYLHNSDTNFPLLFGDFTFPALDINGQLFVEEELSAIADLYAFQRIFYNADAVTAPQTFYLTIENDIIKKQSIGTGVTYTVEQLIVTAPNTLSNLSTIPTDLDKTVLNVNGEVIPYIGAPHAYTIVGVNITWNPIVAGYNLAITDKVVITYI